MTNTKTEDVEATVKQILELEEATKENPVLGGLVVPLEQLPEVRRQFHTGAGRYYTLYRKAQGNG